MTEIFRKRFGSSPRKERPGDPRSESTPPEGSEDPGIPGVRLVGKLEAGKSIGKEDTLYRLAFSPAGTHLAATRDGQPCIWELGSGRALDLSGESASYWDLDWSDDGTRLAVDGVHEVVVFAIDGSRTILRQRIALADPVFAIRWLPHRNVVAVGEGGAIRLLDLASPSRSPAQIRGHEREIDGLAVASDGLWLASASHDGSVAIWSLQDNRLVWRAAKAHGGSFAMRVAFDPKGRWVASVGADRTLAIWSADKGRLLHRAQGHGGAVLEIAVSIQGELVATIAWDNTVRLWRTDRWEEVACLPGFGLKSSNWLGLAFHPHESLLATVSLDGHSVLLWHIDLDVLLGRAPREDAVQYTCAKVVLVGDSAVGKSGLGLVLQGEPWRETSSTHGRQVRMLDREESAGEGGRQCLRETYLWDLAGQPGYRLVNQLSLGDVALAMIVFDAQSETDPLAGVRYWNRALEQAKLRAAAQALPLRKLLVMGRADRGGVALSPDRLEQVRQELGCQSVHRTSAKEGWGIPELKAELQASIKWDELPKVSSNDLFVGIQRFLRETKDSGLVLSPAESLFQQYLGSATHRESSFAADAVRPAFDTCLGLLEGQGLLARLRFGGLVLLQPELLDAYAGAMVNAARDEPGGLGALSEEVARQGRFEMASDFRVPDREQEKLLLIATVEHLLQHELVLREPADDGVQIVFPAELTRQNPALPEPEHPVGRYRFQGPTRNIYTTLVVRLAHSPLFGKPELWRDAAEFPAALGGRSGVQLRTFGEGSGELVLFRVGPANDEAMAGLRAYVQTHLDRRALPGTVEEQWIFACRACETTVSDAVVRKRRERGFDWLDCPVCGEKVELVTPRGLSARAEGATIAEIDEGARARRELAQAAQVVAGKRQVGDYDVFLCHNSVDKPAVKAVAQKLCDRGLLPWIDERDLRPGQSWQAQIEKQIDQMRSAAVFIGPSGSGPWQKKEVSAILTAFANANRPVIPVLLPGSAEPKDLPLFLRDYHAVKLGESDPDPIAQLVWGITGEPPH